MRAAAYVIIGFPLSTPSHAVMVEAGRLPVAARRSILAARFLVKAQCSRRATRPEWRKKQIRAG